MRTARERHAPMRHRTFGIEFRCLLERPDGGAVVKSVKKTKPLIEVALCFGRVGGDLARVGAEAS
jgi:hypothetical protein